MIDKSRPEQTRPGIDRRVAAGIPQQNFLEMVVWAALVTGLMAAMSLQLLAIAGAGVWITRVLAVPVTFVLFHAGIVFFGAIAGLAGPGVRGRIRAWAAGGSVAAGWLILSSGAMGWTVWMGWVWLGWMGLNGVAWIIDRLWKTSTVDSQ